MKDIILLRVKLPRVVNGLVALAFWISALTLGMPSASFGTDYTWVGGGAEGNWDVAACWDSNPTLPTFNADTTIIYYQTGAGYLDHITQVHRTIGSLIYNSNVTAGVTTWLQNRNNAGYHLTLGSGTVAPALTVEDPGQGVTNRIVPPPSGYGYIYLANNLTVTINGTAGNLLSIDAMIWNSWGITKKGAGTLFLNATNSGYTGDIALEAGQLRFGKNNTLNSNNNINLKGGTLQMGTVSNTVGTLMVTSNAVIDLGNGSGNLSLADSFGLEWTGTLTLTNTLGAKTLQFRGNGLSFAQLCHINIIEGPYGRAGLDENGYVVKLPPLPKGVVLIVK